MERNQQETETQTEGKKMSKTETKKTATPKPEIKRKRDNETWEYYDEEVTPVVGMHATVLGWSDRHPCEVIAFTANTITLRAMAYEMIEKPEFIPGGFSAICVKEAKYRVFSNPEGHVFKAHYRPSQKRYVSKCGRVSLGYASKFYDHNF